MYRLTNRAIAMLLSVFMLFSIGAQSAEPLLPQIETIYQGVNELYETYNGNDPYENAYEQKREVETPEPCEICEFDNEHNHGYGYGYGYNDDYDYGYDFEYGDEYNSDENDCCDEHYDCEQYCACYEYCECAEDCGCLYIEATAMVMPLSGHNVTIVTPGGVREFFRDGNPDYEMMGTPSGFINPVPGGPTTITALLSSGFRVTRWDIRLSSTNELLETRHDPHTLEFNVTEDITIEVTVDIESWLVTFDNTIISAHLGTPDEPGASVTSPANIGPGFNITFLLRHAPPANTTPLWIVTDTTTNSPIITRLDSTSLYFPLNNDINVTVNFLYARDVNINFTGSGNISAEATHDAFGDIPQTITPPGGSALQGSEVVFTAIADSGHFISGWTVDNEPVNPNPPGSHTLQTLTIDSLEYDVVVRVNFAPINVNISPNTIAIENTALSQSVGVDLTVPDPNVPGNIALNLADMQGFHVTGSGTASLRVYQEAEDGPPHNLLLTAAYNSLNNTIDITGSRNQILSDIVSSFPIQVQLTTAYGTASATLTVDVDLTPLPRILSISPTPQTVTAFTNITPDGLVNADATFDVTGLSLNEVAADFISSIVSGNVPSWITPNPPIIVTPVQISPDGRSATIVLRMTISPNTTAATRTHNLTIDANVPDALPVRGTLAISQATPIVLIPYELNITNYSPSGFTVVDGFDIGNLTLSGTNQLPTGVTYAIDQDNNEITISADRNLITEAVNTTVTLTVACSNGGNASLTVNINVTPSAPTISPDRLEINNGNLVRTFTVTPTGAARGNVALRGVLPAAIEYTVSTFGTPVAGAYTVTLTGERPVSGEPPIQENNIGIFVSIAGSEEELLILDVNLTPPPRIDSLEPHVLTTETFSSVGVHGTSPGTLATTPGFINAVFVVTGNYFSSAENQQEVLGSINIQNIPGWISAEERSSWTLTYVSNTEVTVTIPLRVDHNRDNPPNSRDGGVSLATNLPTPPHHTPNIYNLEIFQYGPITLNPNEIDIGNAPSYSITEAISVAGSSGVINYDQIFFTPDGGVAQSHGDVMPGFIELDISESDNEIIVKGIRHATDDIIGELTVRFIRDELTAMLTINVNLTALDEPNVTWPTEPPFNVTFSAIFGDTLSHSRLAIPPEQGFAISPNAPYNTVQGTFSWTTPTEDVGNVASSPNSRSMTFTPTGEDAYNYAVMTTLIPITVNPATPIVTWPLGIASTVGEFLGTVTTTGSTVAGSAEFNGVDVPGTFVWTNPPNPATTLVGNRGERTHSMTFRPNSQNFRDDISAPVTITVAPRQITITGVSAVNRYFDGTTTVALQGTNIQLQGVLPEHNVGFTLGTGVISSPNVANGVAVTTSITLTGDDADNYELIQPTVTVNILLAPPPTIVFPTAGDITFRQTLGNSALNENSASTEHGTFAWQNPAYAPNASPLLQPFPMIFTPTYPDGFNWAVAPGWNANTGGPGVGGIVRNVDIRVNQAGGLVATPTTVMVFEQITDAQTLSLDNILLNYTDHGARNFRLGALTGTNIFATVPSLSGSRGESLNFTGAGLTSGEAAQVIYIDTQNFTTITVIIAFRAIDRIPLYITGITINPRVFDGNMSATVSGTAVIYNTQDILPDFENIGLTGTPTATFTRATAGDDIPVTIAGLSLTGADSNFYRLILTGFTGNITPRPLRIVGVTAPNHVFDGNTGVSINQTGGSFEGVGGASGLISGFDDVTFTLPTTGTVANANVANGVAVTIAGASISGDDAANYFLFEQPETTVNITQRPITFTQGTLAVTREYDGTTNPGTAIGSPVTTDSIFNNDRDSSVVGVTATPGNFPNSDVGEHTINVTLGLTGSGMNNYQIANPTLVIHDAKITQATSVVNWALLDLLELTVSHGYTLAAVTPDIRNINNSDLVGALPQSTPGTFSWTAGDSTSVGGAGNRPHNVTFTPDSNNFTEVSRNVTVLVTGANPVVNWPVGLTATYGQTLADVPLMGFNNAGGTPGWFEWVDEDVSVGNAGTRYHLMRFYPFSENYNPMPSANPTEGYGVQVIVTRANQPAPAISYNNAPVTTLTRTTDDTSVTLTAEGGAGDGELEWSSSNPAVATVNQYGVVTVHTATGFTDITVRRLGGTNHNDSPWSAHMRLTVILPQLSGTPVFSGNNRIGQILTVDTSALTGQGIGGAFVFEWRVGGEVISGVTGNQFTISGAHAGRSISVVITRPNSATGSVSGNFDNGLAVPFNVVLGSVSDAELIDLQPTDDVTIPPDSHGRVGTPITLSYYLSYGNRNPQLPHGVINFVPLSIDSVFSGVDGRGSGTRTYIINAADAVDGIITISATFIHADLHPRTLYFLNSEESRVFNSGTFIVFPNATPPYIGGSDTVVFTSSDTTVAEVHPTTGEVTIIGAGETTISATIQATSTHLTATAIYTLTITRANRPAPTGITHTNETSLGGNDGTISGVTDMMQWIKDGGTTWNNGNGTTIAGLAPGTYLVRYSETTDFFESSPVNVEILPAPTITSIEPTAETVSEFANITFGDIPESGKTMIAEFLVQGIRLNQDLIMNEVSIGGQFTPAVLPSIRSAMIAVDGLSATLAVDITVFPNNQIGDNYLEDTVTIIFLPNLNVTGTLLVRRLSAPFFQVIITNNPYANSMPDGQTGQGEHQQGQPALLAAGTREGYTFVNWTSDELEIPEADSEEISFIMPGRSVTITANWLSDTPVSEDPGSDFTPTVPVSPNDPSAPPPRPESEENDGDGDIDMDSNNIGETGNGAGPGEAGNGHDGTEEDPEVVPAPDDSDTDGDRDTAQGAGFLTWLTSNLWWISLILGAAIILATWWFATGRNQKKKGKESIPVDDNLSLTDLTVEQNE